MKIRGSRHLQRKLALIISMATCTAIFFILFLTYYTRTTKEADSIAPQAALKEEEKDLLSLGSEQDSLLKALKVKSESQSKEIEGLIEQLHHAQNKLSQSEKKLSAYYEDNLQKKLRELNSSLDSKNQLIEDAKELITNKIIPAYQELNTFLKDEYLPQSRDSIGLDGVPNGKK